MKYKIIKSDILLGGRLLPEGSEIELTKEQTKGIEDYLLQISDSQQNKKAAKSGKKKSK